MAVQGIAAGGRTPAQRRARAGIYASCGAAVRLLRRLSGIAGDLELSSQLFDYMRRRYAMQQDGRFFLHDEWDYFGTYLNGFLDPADPRFAKQGRMDRISLDGFDKELQDYYYSLSSPRMTTRPKPRRAIPKRLLELLKAIEDSGAAGRTDAMCLVLGWSDEGLNELESGLAELRRKTVWDGRARVITIQHPWKTNGVSLAAGHDDRRAIQDLLVAASADARRQSKTTEWAGFAVDLATPFAPLTIYYPPAGRTTLAGTVPK